MRARLSHRTTSSELSLPRSNCPWTATKPWTSRFGPSFLALPITSSTTSSFPVSCAALPGRLSPCHARDIHAPHYLELFLLVKASSRQTPQPSPAFHSAIARLQGVEFVGTEERISALRGACLTRDRHRCAVTRKFDRAEASSALRGPAMRPEMMMVTGSTTNNMGHLSPWKFLIFCRTP